LLEQAGYHVGYINKGYAPGSSRERGRNPCGPRVETFREFMERRPDGAPICFWLGSRNPHRPYDRGAGVAMGKDPAGVAVPPYLPDHPEIRKDITDYFTEVEAFDQEVAEVIELLEARGELDQTLFIVTGDNGWPFPRAKTNCYNAGTHEPLAIRWGTRITGGRQVYDFVSLADLCPTILEAAGVPVPDQVTGRSLLPILRSDKSGWIEPERDHVITAMETHVPVRALPDGRKGGYPMRAIITRDYHYIRNFTPERLPGGDPAARMDQLDFEGLATRTHASYSDIDASPTKAVLVLQREDPGIRPFFESVFGRRPARELFDRAADPAQLRNLAADPAYAAVVDELEKRLMAELARTGDPRAHGRGSVFDDYSVNPPSWERARSAK
jgi:N-sulfoglucosamine sulfohydrolase